MIGFLGFLKESVLLLENRIKFFANQTKMPEEHIEKLASADPNPKRKNLGWLVKQHKNGHIRSDMLDTFHPDDISSHREVLTRLEDLRKTEPKSSEHIGDIMKHHDRHSLHQAIDDYHENHGKVAHENKWGKKVFDEDGHHIYHAETAEQCSNHGQGTGWCTRIKNGQYQDHYRENGNLFVHYPKGTPKPGEKGHDEHEGRHQFWIPHEAHENHQPEIKNFHNGTVHSYAHENEHKALRNSPHWKSFKDAEYNHEEISHDEGIDDYIHDLVHSDNWRDRVEAVRDHGAHDDFHHLKDDEHEEVRKAVIDHEFTQSETHRNHAFADYRHDHDVEVRAHLASKLIDKDHIKSMYDDIPKISSQDEDEDEDNQDHTGTLHAIASNRYVPHSVMESMINNDKGMASSDHHYLLPTLIANPASKTTSDINPEPSTHLHEKILNHPDGISRRAAEALAEAHLGTHPVSKSFVDMMASHKNPSVRRVVAAYHGRNESYLHQLKNDEDNSVRVQLAKHHPDHFLNDKSLEVQHTAFSGLPADKKAGHPILDHFAEQGEHHYEHHNAVAEHGTPEQIMKPNVLNSKSRDVPLFIHHRMHSDENLQNHDALHQALATSKNPGMRSAAATFSKNPRLLHSLKNDADHKVTGSLFHNPHVSHDTILHLVNNDEQIGKHVARAIGNPEAYGKKHLDNHELHNKLAAHSHNKDVLGAIAGASSSHQALRTLVDRKKHGWSIVANPHTPHEILNHYANHENKDLSDFAKDEIHKRQMES